MGSSDLSSVDERARTFGASSDLSAIYDATAVRYLMPDLDVADPAILIEGPQPDAPLVAIVDTGLVNGHPVLATRVVDQEDFTASKGEVNDGHGSLVALRHLAVAPNSRLLSAKVFGDDNVTPAVQAERIGAGIRWAAERGAHIIVVCVGFRSKCKPEHRPLCEAVRDTLDNHDVMVVVAGEARCPAECDSRAIVLGELEPDGQVDSLAFPDFVFETPGRVRTVPWDQWVAEHSTREEITW